MRCKISAITFSECRGPVYPAMLWSACVYAGLVTALWLAYSHGFAAALGTQSFETAVMGYLDIAYHLIDLAIPINNWREAHLVASYMASWVAFQVHRNSAALRYSNGTSSSCKAVPVLQ
jgi:hypothetical protein